MYSFCGLRTIHRFHIHFSDALSQRSGLHQKAVQWPFGSAKRRDPVPEMCIRDSAECGNADDEPQPGGRGAEGHSGICNPLRSAGPDDLSLIHI